MTVPCARVSFIRGWTCLRQIWGCHPQSNGICERLHRPIQEEFYFVAFRKKIYSNLLDLQQDLDEWMKYYNNERTHSGRYCFGKTPTQTFNETLNLARQKLIG